MKKDTTSHSLSDPKIQEAISNADSTFDKVSNRYDSVSKDIKQTEKYLDGKDVKSTFAFNFCRIEDMCTGDGGDDYPGWDPETFGQETLDWRKDPVSNRYRLMVSHYDIEIENYEGPNGYESTGHSYLVGTKPLIESPIEDRLYYHPRLSQFITSFADAVQKHLIDAGSETLDILYHMKTEQKYKEEFGEKKFLGLEFRPEVCRSLSKGELSLRRKE